MQQLQPNETQTEATTQTLQTSDIHEHEKKFWELFGQTAVAYMELINITKQFKQQQNGKI